MHKPFLLRPSGKDYIWGGKRLNDEFEKNIPLSPLAETWECSTHPAGPSWVVGGEFDGMELDRTKWDYRLHMANKRHECFIEDAVSFDGNSHIIFHLVEKDGQYYSSALQTGENYTDKHPLEYFLKGKAKRFIHENTSNLLESWLLMLSEKGEDETCKYIKNYYKQNKGK